ncbi:MAG: hypothetical protein P8P15_06560 [Polaribacter sp.]|nr:hypothetical protein [Polaribacter sp.]
MRFYKFLSIILHPIVVPTISVILYFILVPNGFNANQRMIVLGLIFISTYAIPLTILFLLKRLKLINSFKANTIKERKLPIVLMIFLFYLLGNTIKEIHDLKDISLLFYATTLGLLSIYILFYFQLKTSIHLLSLGITTGFFFAINNVYSANFMVVIISGLLLSGTLASARLNLKAHTPTEVYLGFVLGFICPITVYLFL